MRDTKKLKNAFRSQRHSAKRRGIAFVLSFEEWLDIWEKSGHLSKRGCGRGCYVMARPNDSGPYKADNVVIILHEHNVCEAHVGRAKTKAQRVKMGAAQRAQPFARKSLAAKKAAQTVRGRRRAEGNLSRRDAAGLYGVA